MSETIIGITDFNRDDERLQFGCQDRVVDVVCVGNEISFSLLLTDKQDSVMTLSFDREDLIRQIIRVTHKPDD